MAAFRTYEEIAAWAMGRELVKEIYRLTKGGAFSTFQPFNPSTHIIPNVSFILPVYKRRFLHEAIASILAQGYRVDGRRVENGMKLLDWSVISFAEGRWRKGVQVAPRLANGH